MEAFLKIFDEKVENDSLLKEFEINENYKREIYKISGKIDTISEKQDEILSELKNIASKETTGVNEPNGFKHYLEKLPLYHTAFIGRKKELDMLDAAWQNPHCNIVVMKAAGGVGKTALVGHWLTNRMQPKDYDGARWVYAWSFYSQGASEGSQPSAEPFINDALQWFEVSPLPTTMHEKARKLADVIAEKRGLLIIDGMEPLQYPMGETLNKEKHTGLEGQLKDKALEVLLKQLAARNEGLCIISTRLELTSLKSCNKDAVKMHNLEYFTPDDGAELLKAMGVRGKKEELLQTSRDLKGHALTLKLLATLLTTYHKGDIRRKDKIKDLTDDTQEGGHAWRVMASYMDYINLAELSLLYFIGLFDRPARVEVLDEMVTKKAAPQISDAFNKIKPDELKECVQHLERLGLLIVNQRETIPLGFSYQSLKGLEKYETLDAHPLVREFFGKHLQTNDPETYHQANLFLCEYFKEIAKELPNTLEEMEPLFQAVAYGCRAGKQQEV